MTESTTLYILHYVTGESPTPMRSSGIVCAYFKSQEEARASLSRWRGHLGNREGDGFYIETLNVEHLSEGGAP